MKRLMLITAALAALATTLPVGDLAMAKDHGGGPPHGDRGRGPPDRGRGGPPERGPDRRGDERRYNDRRGGDERQFERGRRDLRQEDRRDDGRRRYEEGPYPDARPARRGGYLPDNYRGGTVDDYQRYRLRPPPRGYAWVRVNGGYALVSVEDGRIFDVIPD